MTPSVLIVEDGPQVMETIEDTLYWIGHEHVWLANQFDARAALRSQDFRYVLRRLYRLGLAWEPAPVLHATETSENIENNTQLGPNPITGVEILKPEAVRKFLDTDKSGQEAAT